jgi:hypothetical protein
MKLEQVHDQLCGKGAIELLDSVFSESASFYIGLNTAAILFPSVLSPADLQQLADACYYDTSKYEGQQDAMFTAACTAEQLNTATRKLTHLLLFTQLWPQLA